MFIHSAVRRWVHAHPRLRRAYLWLRFAPAAEMRRRIAVRKHGREWTRELVEASRIPASGLYDLEVPLDNPTESYQGRNFLGLPPMSGITLDTAEIGWKFGQHVSVGEFTLPSFQVRTDLEHNFPLLFDTYRPSFVVDFGTASGASSAFFADLMARYEPKGKVLTVDLNDPTRGAHGPTFRRLLEQLPITSHVGDALARDTEAVVRRFLGQRRDEPVLLSFDDDHSATHVLDELRLYGPMIRNGDVIVVQDTWDQGFRDTPFSALLGVLRFLNQESAFALDLEVLRKVTLPCSFVHGLIVRS